MLAGAAAAGTILFDRMRLLGQETAAAIRVRPQGLVALQSGSQQILQDLDVFLGRFLFNTLDHILAGAHLGCLERNFFDEEYVSVEIILS